MFTKFTLNSAVSQPDYMVLRFVESLLITIFNSARRGWVARKQKQPLPEPQIVAPPEHVVIGHVISEQEDASDAIAKELLKEGIVALTPEARRRHLYVLGATGTGKTNLLLRLIESDIRNKRAFCVIDLRGDLVDRILPRLASAAPAEEWRERLLLLDLRRSEHVVGFNPLAGEGEGDTYTRALHLLEVLKLQSDSWGVQLEETLRNSLIALSETGWSLLEIEPLLSNPAFRAEVLGQVSDSHVKNFFERFDKLSEANKLSWTLAVLNKITPLLAIDRLHHSAHLTGGLLVSAFQSAMMSRVDQPEAERVPAFLYVDEFEMMATERFQEIVAEGRRFGVGLTLSHQNLSQLGVGLRNVLRNNVHTQIYFQTGAIDAAELAKEITGSESREDIRSTLIIQGVGEAYLVRRGQPSLRIRTLHCPDPAVDKAAVAAIREASLGTYTRLRTEIEQELGSREKQIRALDGKAVPSSKPTYEIRHAKTSTFKPKSQEPGDTNPGEPQSGELELGSSEPAKISKPDTSRKSGSKADRNAGGKSERPQ